MEKRVLLLILSLFLLFQAVNVCAVGLGSQSMWYKVDFKPNAEYAFDYALLTTSTETMDYELYVQMHTKEDKLDLTKYVSFDPAALKDAAPGSMPMFRATIKLPAALEPPGEHPIDLCVQETIADESGTIGSRSGACGIVTVRVLFHGKYLISNLEASNSALGRPVRFLISLENVGDVKIEKASAVITIYDAQNKTVKTFNAGEASVAPGGKNSIVSFMDTFDMLAGEYRAVAEITWDGKTSTSETKFRIGSLEIEIVSGTSTFKANSINPWNVKIKSDWNTGVDNVFAKINVDDTIELKTPSEKIDAWQEKVLTTYWDTANISLGKHKAKITLYYESKTNEKKYTVEVLEEIEKQLEKPLQSGILSNTLLIVLIAAILVILAIISLLNIFLLLQLRKEKKKGK